MFWHRNEHDIVVEHLLECAVKPVIVIDLRKLVTMNIVSLQYESPNVFSSSQFFF